MDASKDNMKRWLLISSVIVSICLLPIACSGEALLSGSAIDKLGTYTSPGGGYTALLEHGEGDMSVLTIVSKSDGRRSKSIDAVTGIVWISESKLLYSVSPIYGIPGIFVFDCRKMKMKRILGPKTFRKGWPDGVDDFQLKEFSEGKIYFYYAPDIETANPYALDLYQINLDGTGFKKAQGK
jgi:hypothetical protein